MTTNTWRVGVLGTGEQAEESRIPSLLALAGEGVEVVAVADLDTERARRVAGIFGIRTAVGSLQEMIEAAGREGTPLDAVVITVPHGAHASSSIEALRAGLHVLCEKPMATTVLEAEEMIEAAQRHERVLAIGYQYPFMVGGLVETILPMIGKLLSIRARWLRRSGIPDRPSFWVNAETGGADIDLLGHLLSATAPWVTGRPRSVTALGWNEHGVARYGDDFRAFDTVEAQFVFPGRVLGNLRVSWASNIPEEERIELLLRGTDGDVLIRLLGGETDASEFAPVLTRRVRTAEGLTTEVERLHDLVLPTTDECLVMQARNWLDAARGEAELLSPAERGLDLQVVLDAVRESAQNDGDQVRLDD